MFLRYSLRYEGFKLVKSFPFWSYIWHYSLSCYYFLLERKNHFYKVISAGRSHFELLRIPLLDCFHSKQKVTCTRGLNLTFCFKNEILLPFLTLSYLKEYLENIGFLWANFSKNVTWFLSGIFLYQKWSLTPHSSSFEINFWIFKSDLGSATGIPARLAMLEKSRNLQRRHFLIINELGLLTKNLLDI